MPPRSGRVEPYRGVAVQDRLPPQGPGGCEFAPVDLRTQLLFVLPQRGGRGTPDKVWPARRASLRMPLGLPRPHPQVDEESTAAEAAARAVSPWGSELTAKEPGRPTPSPTPVRRPVWNTIAPDQHCEGNRRRSVDACRISVQNGRETSR